jgi:hypothetical protein
MLDTNELRDIAKNLRTFAGKIRKDGPFVAYPTAALDAERLEKDATQLERTADEIECLLEELFAATGVRGKSIDARDRPVTK